MSPQVTHFVSAGEALVGVAVLAWALFLISAPMHPAPTDSHGGMLAVFSGLALIPLSGVLLLAGRTLRRGSSWGWLAQLAAIVACAALLVIVLS